MIVVNNLEGGFLGKEGSIDPLTLALKCFPEETQGQATPQLTTGRQRLLTKVRRRGSQRRLQASLVSSSCEGKQGWSRVGKF